MFSLSSLIMESKPSQRWQFTKTADGIDATYDGKPFGQVKIVQGTAQGTLTDGKPMRPDFIFSILKTADPETLFGNAQLIYDYAEALDRPVPEGEATLLRDASPTMLANYAEYFRKSKWPEAEAKIKEDPAAWRNYSDTFAQDGGERPAPPTPKPVETSPHQFNALLEQAEG